MKPGSNLLLFSIALLFLVGAVFYLSNTLTSLGSVTPKLPQKNQTPAVATGASSYSGTIVKVEGDPINGTHLLLDKDGKTMAYLESRKIDLKILEQTSVVLEGARERMVEVGVPLLLVEKVNFR